MRGLCVPFTALDGRPDKKVWRISGPKLVADKLVHDPAVGATAGEFYHDRFHHPAEVLRRGPAGFGDGLVDRPLYLSRIDRRREIGFEHGYFRRFAGRELFASPLLKLLDRIPPLFDERGDH